jgi:hypothetical protein
MLREAMAREKNAGQNDSEKVASWFLKMWCVSGI